MEQQVDGPAVCKEIFKRSPVCLHAIDISENNLVELVRQLGALVDILMVNLKPLWIVVVRNIHHSYILIRDMTIF